MTSAAAFLLTLAVAMGVLTVMQQRSVERQIEALSKAAGKLPEVYETGGCEYCKPEMYPKRGE